jgi:hypothetical protein
VFQDVYGDKQLFNKGKGFIITVLTCRYGDTLYSPAHNASGA